MLCFGTMSLGAHQPIDGGGRVGLVGRIQDDQDVSVRKAALLELDGVHVAFHAPQHMLFEEVVLELAQLVFEDAQDNVRAFVRLLTGQQVASNFGPGGVAGDGDKEVWPAEGSHDRRRVLRHVALASDERRREVVGLASCWSAPSAAAASTFSRSFDWLFMR